MQVTALNNTQDQVFVMQMGDGQPFALPPLSVASKESPSVQFSVPAGEGTLTCWLPLNNTTKGPAKVLVDLTKVPSRVNTPSTDPKEAEAGIVYVFDVRAAASGSGIEFGLFKAAGGAAGGTKPKSGLTAQEKSALKEVGVVGGIVVGAFFGLWVLVRTRTWIQGKMQHKKDRAAMEALSTTSE